MKTIDRSFDFRRRRLRIRFLVLAMAAPIVLAACRKHGDDPNSPIRVSGNIEVVDVRLAFKQPGRVVERRVDEGEEIKKGMVIARLDDAEFRHEMALREAEVEAAQAMLAELEAGSRSQDIASAEAVVRRAEAEVHRAGLEFERQRELRATESAAARELERADAELRVAEARAVEATERLALVREGPRVEVIAQSRARVRQAEAALALAHTRLAETILYAPFDGVALEKHVEPGEFLMIGAPVITVADTSSVWLRAFVNQTDLGRIRLGQAVEVRTDSHPDKTYEGRLAFISSRAEFTPKTVQTEKERVTLVFRIKVDLDNSSGELKPGMAADAELAAAGAE